MPDKEIVDPEGNVSEGFFSVEPPPEFSHSLSLGMTTGYGALGTSLSTRPFSLSSVTTYSAPSGP